MLKIASTNLTFAGSAYNSQFQLYYCWFCFTHKRQRLTLNICFLMEYLLQFISRSTVDSKQSLVQVIIWRGTGDNPLPELMMTKFSDAIWQHWAKCVDRFCHLMCLLHSNNIVQCVLFVIITAKGIQYIPRNMHTVFALLCFVVVTHWLIFPYPSGLLHWHCGNLTIAPVPAKQPWWIWINTSCEFIMNDCITTTKQSTTKPCAHFLGYTVCYIGCNYFSIVISSW